MPVVNTWPPCRSIAARTTASCAGTAVVMSAGACSQSRVESSMPVNRNVTVPEGGSADTAGPYRRTGVRSPELGKRCAATKCR